MLSDFAEKKTCFDHKKQKKNPLTKKMPFFSLLRFGQNKTTNNA